MGDRTLFYSLELIGAGTGQVESLRSYVQRLSLQHNLRPVRLIEALVAKFPLESPVDNLSQVANLWHVHGASQLGRQLRDRLALATGIDLTTSTLTRLAHVLGQTHFVKPAGQAFYCPACVTESEQSQTFGRLLWEVECVTICPRHRIRLRSIKGCGADPSDHLATAWRPSAPGVCSCCGSVGFRCVNEPHEAASEAEVWVAQQTERLLCLTGEEIARLTSESLREGLQALVDQRYGGRVTHAALACGMSVNQIFMWLSYDFKPGLSSLVQICHHEGCDLVSLLQGRLVSIAEPTTEGTHYKRVVKRHPARKLSNDEVRQLILDAAREQPPPTLKELGGRFGRSGDLRQYPAELEILRSATTAYRDAQRARLIAETTRCFEESAQRLIAVGRKVTRSSLTYDSGLYVSTRTDSRFEALKTVLERHAHV